MKKKMGSAGYWLVAFVLILAIACGGGGGGGSTGGPGGGPGGGTTGGNTALGSQAATQGFYIEFQNGSGAPFDPVNLRPGTSVRLQGVRYDQFGNKTTVNNAITLSGNTAGVTFDGSRNLSSAGNSAFFTANMNVTVDGTTRTITQEVRFTNATIAVTGTVNTFLARVPKFLQVDIFDNNGNKVGAGMVAGNGVFRANVTSTAANRFTFNGNSIDNFNESNSPSDTAARFYKVLRYQSINYSAGDIGCAAPLPSVTSSGATLPATVFLPEVSSGPPPPPSGCN